MESNPGLQVSLSPELIQKAWKKHSLLFLTDLHEKNVLKDLIPPTIRSNRIASERLSDVQITKIKKLAQKNMSIKGAFIDMSLGLYAASLYSGDFTNRHDDVRHVLYLHLEGMHFSLDEELFPSEQECLKALDDDKFLKNLIAKFENCFIHILALIVLNRVDFFSNIFRKNIQNAMSSEMTSSLEKIGKMFRNINTERIQFRNSIVKIRNALANELPLDELPLWRNACQDRAFDFAEQILDNTDNFRNEIIFHLKETTSKKIDTDAIRNMLAHVEPQIPQGDMALILEDLRKVDEDGLTPKESVVLSVLIPVIRGESDLDDDSDVFESYSNGFVRKLEKRVYHLPDEDHGKDTVLADAADTANACADPESGGETADPEDYFSETPADSAVVAEEANCKDIQEASGEESVPEEDGERGVEADEAPGKTSASTDVPEAEHTDEGAGAAQEDVGGFPLPAGGESATAEDAEKDVPQTLPTNSPQDVMDARNADAGQDDDPAPERVRACVDAILYRKDTAGLYWLMRSLRRPPVPVWLAELLHLGIHLTPSFPQAARRLAELATDGGGRLEELDAHPQLFLLLAAGMLRPALMAPHADQGGILSTLGSRLSEWQCTGLMRNLASFVPRGTPLDPSVFTAQNPMAQRQDLRKRLRERTEEFLDRMRSGKNKYQPATVVKKRIFDRNGTLGKRFEECLADRFDEIGACLDRYLNNRSAIRTLIVDTDENSGRSRSGRKPIEARALEALEKDITEGLTLLGDWQGLAKLGKMSDEDRSHSYDVLKTIIAGMDAALPPETPEGQLFRSAMVALRECQSKRLPAEEHDPADTLRLWPMFVPFPSPGAAKDFPAKDILQWLEQNALDDPGRDAACLALHMLHGNLRDVESALGTFPEKADDIPDKTLLKEKAGQNAVLTAEDLDIPLEDFLQRQKKRWQEHFERAKEGCIQKIADAFFRGAIQYGQNDAFKARYADICRQYSPPDDDGIMAAQGVRAFEDLEGEIAREDDAQLHALEDRLDSLLAHSPLSREAANRLEEIRADVRTSRSYGAAHAAIVEVEEHLVSGAPLRPNVREHADGLSSGRDFYDALKEGAIPACSMRDKKLWDDVVRLQNTRFSPQQVAVVTEFLRRLGFSLAQDRQAQYIFNEGAPHFWRMIRYQMDILPPRLPQWGSGASEHTVIFGWEVSPDKLIQFLQSQISADRISRTTAVTVICCSPLHFEARQKLLALCAGIKYTPLVIDSNLFSWLATRDGNPTHAMFEAAFAGAFHNPYTPEAAGALPTEMFFGRENAKADILDPHGSCFIYGGRQLGKTALLQEIARQPGNGRLAILHTMHQTETSIVDAVITELGKKKIISSNTTKKTFMDNVLSYLNNPDSSYKSILVLLDECDRVLELDVEKEFEDTEIIRNMMQNSGRKFKIVLTGLHSVQRFSQKPNSPLYHFGTPICIGPLPPDTAQDLVIEPMRILGITFNDAQLVSMALNYCNYQPKIIQMFCRELLNEIFRIRKTYPWYEIDRETILKVHESRELQKKILECFDMTLNLDERYLVIAYTMALLDQNRLSDHSGAGIPLQELQTELRYFWPDAFKGELGGYASLESLLHEMEGLGLLLSLGGTYRLRTPNVINLLGGEQNIIARLDEYGEKPYEPRGNPDVLRLKGARALVASQYNQIAEKRTGLVLISGSRALGMDEVPDALREIARSRHMQRFDEIRGDSAETILADVRSIYDSVESGGILAWIRLQDAALARDFEEQVGTWLAKLRTGRKFVKIVALLEAATLLDFRRGAHVADPRPQPNVHHLRLRPWSHESLDVWRRENGRSIDPEKIMRVTNGWPGLVAPVLDGCPMPDGATYLAERGCCFPEDEGVRQVFQILSTFADDSLSPQDIWQFCEEEGTAVRTAVDLGDILDTLQDLHVLRQDGDGLRLDSLVAGSLGQETA